MRANRHPTNMHSQLASIAQWSQPCLTKTTRTRCIRNISSEAKVRQASLKRASRAQRTITPQKATSFPMPRHETQQTLKQEAALWKIKRTYKKIFKLFRLSKWKQEPPQNDNHTHRHQASGQNGIEIGKHRWSKQAVPNATFSYPA